MAGGSDTIQIAHARRVLCALSKEFQGCISREVLSSPTRSQAPRSQHYQPVRKPDYHGSPIRPHLNRENRALAQCGCTRHSGVTGRRAGLITGVERGVLSL